ncbi:MAG: hypothetical protein ACO3IA_05745 [Candidatus Nanopelagicales bacterium]
MKAKHARKKVRAGNFKFTFLASLVLVVWLGITSFLGPLFGTLSNVQDNDNANF